MHALVGKLKDRSSVGFRRPYLCPSKGHKHGVSIQSFINLGKTVFRISRKWNIAQTWFLAMPFAYLSPFISQILDFLYWMVCSFIPWLWQWKPWIKRNLSIIIYFLEEISCFYCNFNLSFSDNRITTGYLNRLQKQTNKQQKKWKQDQCYPKLIEFFNNNHSLRTPCFIHSNYWMGLSVCYDSRTVSSTKVG